ncbi:hypothetical protein [Thermotoga profunda]|uniref:hypothetical protein n=1 Tax=Thermotoga profunda TaxID=1508420 RepID=UPI000597942D|nr:hypothetical protein [Thermotoga profunda]
MKKVAVLVLGLVLVAALSFAGVFGKGYGNMRQINKQLAYTELIKVLNLSKEQAKQLLDVITETKQQLSNLEQEYKALLEKSKDMTLNELADQRRALNQKHAQILQDAEEKIADILKVSQLENLRNYYFNKMKDYAGQSQQKQLQQIPARPWKDQIPGRFYQQMPMQEKMNRFFDRAQGTGFRLGIILDDDFEETLRAYLQ